jgi:hypothetical protein
MQCCSTYPHTVNNPTFFLFSHLAIFAAIEKIALKERHIITADEVRRKKIMWEKMNKEQNVQVSDTTMMTKEQMLVTNK